MESRESAECTTDQALNGGPVCQVVGKRQVRQVLHKKKHSHTTLARAQDITAVVRGKEQQDSMLRIENTTSLG